MKKEYSKYPKPKTNEQEVLLHLIVENTVSIMDYSYMSGFRTRISRIVLIHGIFLTRVFETGINHHGNKYSYAVHGLPESQKQKAIELYLKLNKN
jgi:hypothetical protein